MVALKKWTGSTWAFVNTQASTTVETFESPTWSVGTFTNGQTISGNLGTWTASVAGSGGTRVAEVTAGQYIHMNDTSASGSCSMSLVLSSKGSPNGTDYFTVKLKVVSADYSGCILFDEVSAANWRVGIYPYAGGALYYYNGSAWVTSGLSWTSNDWNTYDILFQDTSHFKLRQDGGSWTAALTQRLNWSGSGAVIDKMMFGGATGGSLEIYGDDCQASWMSTAGASKVKYCSSGSTFTAKNLKRYNGSTWDTVT